MNLLRLKPPVLLIVGDKDNTAIGKQFALARSARRRSQATIQNWRNRPAARFQMPRWWNFLGIGHAPQIQDPDKFNDTLIDWLQAHSR